MLRSLLPLALLVAGCAAPRQMSVVNFAVVTSTTPTYLRYHVTSPEGESTREIVLGHDAFTERRTVGGHAYTLGILGDEAWLRIADRPAVAIRGDLAADERTEAGWLASRFADPEPGARSEIESCGSGTCTTVYTPDDGHALWVVLDQRTRRPTSFSWITATSAVESCDSLAWSDVDGTLAVARASCSAIVNDVGRETTIWTLEERRATPTAPDWARVEASDVLPLREPERASRFPIADPSQRVYVPVEAGGSPSWKLVLDTGSPVTIVTRRALDALGVAPWPDPSFHAKPPFLPEDTYDPYVVDRLTFGGIELHGVRVLVPRSDGAWAGDEAGLLGMDVLSQFAVDVDGPASALRIGPSGEVPMGVAFTDLSYAGAAHGRVILDGAIDDIGDVPIVLDTGAPLDLVVGGPAMHALHPRRDGSDLGLREGDDSYYASEIDGFALGPFAFPKTPVVAHERRPDLPFLDGDSALVGLGVLRHFRIVVDARRGTIRVAPGPSYYVLARLGLEIDERNGVPTITRIVGDERAWDAPVCEGDVVRTVAGVRVSRRDDALGALAAATMNGAPVHVTIERAGNVVARTLVPS